FLIITDRTGVELFHVGDALIHCRPVGAQGQRGRAPFNYLDALAREAGGRPLSDLVSADPESPLGEPNANAPPDQLSRPGWFSPAEGLAGVRGLLDYLSVHTEAVAEVKRVLAELRKFETVLLMLNDQGILWHLEDCSWW